MQTFYKIDAVLTFKETNHKMYWTMENSSPCSGKSLAKWQKHVKRKLSQMNVLNGVFSYMLGTALVTKSNPQGDINFQRAQNTTHAVDVTDKPDISPIKESIQTHTTSVTPQTI